MNTKLLNTMPRLAIIMLLVSACSIMPTLGSRKLITEARNVSGYDRVEVSDGGSMDIIQDGTEALSVETDDNLMQYVTSDMRGGTLYLSLDSGMRSLLPSHLHFILHVKDLSGIRTSGSWDVISASLKTTNMELVIRGSGKIKVDSLTLVKLSATISGSGELNLA